MVKTKIIKKPNKAYGTPARLRPETVSLVNKLDRRKKNKKGDLISFNEKLYDLLIDLQTRRSYDTKIKDSDPSRKLE